MRKATEPQIHFGQVDISKIEFDLRSRDEIPKLLMGLQYIYCTPEIRAEVFKILEEMVPAETAADKGKPGMLLWKIFVLGTLRLNGILKELKRRLLCLRTETRSVKYIAPHFKNRDFRSGTSYSISWSQFVQPAGNAYLVLKELPRFPCSKLRSKHH